MHNADKEIVKIYVQMQFLVLTLKVNKIIRKKNHI